MRTRLPKDVPFARLYGKTLVSIERLQDDEVMRFTTDSGAVYELYHDQESGEYVCIDDVVGDLNDLLNTPILIAREDVNENSPDGFTWTFYNLATVKGHVTVKWYGASNGYYSEKVSFQRVQ